MKNFVFLTIAILIFLSLIIIFRPAPSKMRRDLFLADSLMQINPDSSLRILQKIGDRKNFSEEDNALYALLKTQSLFRNRIPVTSDSLIRIAVNYYDNSADSLHKAWSNFYLGRIRETTVNKEEALICYQKALSAASGTEDYKLLELIYVYWGLLYKYEKPYEYAASRYRKSLEYAVLLKDTASQIDILRNLAWGYIYFKDTIQSSKYLYEAIKLAKIINDTKTIYDLYHTWGVFYFQNKQYGLAMKYVDMSLVLKSDSLEMASSWDMKGSICYELQKYDSARYYFEKVGLRASLNAKALYYMQLARVDEKVGNYRAAYNNLYSYLVYADSVRVNNREEQLLTLGQKYSYSEVQNENNKLKLAKQQMYIVILLVSLMAIIAIGFLLCYYYRKRETKRGMKDEIEKMKNDLVNQNLIHIQEKTIQMREYQEELFLKEQELGIHLLQKKEQLSLHLQKEQELKEYIFKMDAIVRKIELLNSLKAVQRIKSESEFTLSFQELNNLEVAVNLCYDDFAERLRKDFPKLKDDDVHLCCLLKMKVPNRNILSLLDTNELTLKKRRYRIKRDKMELSDEVDSLDDFISAY